MSQSQEVREAVVLYRRAANGTLWQFEIGAGSAYLSQILKDGTRAIVKSYRIKSQEGGLRDIPFGTPVPESEVPPEPSWHMPDDERVDVPTVPTTPEEAAASGFGRE